MIQSRFLFVCTACLIVFFGSLSTPLFAAVDCNADEEERTFSVPFSYQKQTSGNGVNYQGWFEFEAIENATSYRLEVTSFSETTVPTTLGAVFSYNIENPPTRIDRLVLHETGTGTIGVYVIHSSANVANDRALERLDGFYTGIEGQAVVTFECKEVIDISVLATFELEKRGDATYVTLSAALTNEGEKEASDVKLVLHYLTSRKLGDEKDNERKQKIPEQLHIVDIKDDGGNCKQEEKFVGGSLVCEDITIAKKSDSLGRNVYFVDIFARVTNVADLRPIVFEALVDGDIDLSNNDDTVRAMPELKPGSIAQTRKIMEILDTYFSYDTDIREAGCNVYRDDIYSRLEKLHAENPEVFDALAYGPVTSGDYTTEVGTSAGHVGVVVYPKGTDYHETGIVIHGTPSVSPLGAFADSYDTQVWRFEKGEQPEVSRRRGTTTHGYYYRTPVVQFPGYARPEKNGCGFEGPYPDNVSEFSRTPPTCVRDTDADTCPFDPNAVILQTESPVDLLIENNLGQQVETLGGQIVSQQLETSIHSMALPHENGTFAWTLVLPEDDYNVKLIGVADGAYKLTMTTFDEQDDPNSEITEGLVSVGQEELFTVAAAHLAIDDKSSAVTNSGSENGGGSSGGGATNLSMLLLGLLLGRFWLIQHAGRRRNAVVGTFRKN